MGNANELKEFLQKCEHAVLHDARHNLELGYRHRIYASLGSAPNEGPLGSTLGHNRRYHLALLAAAKVLPVWESARPQDRTPHSILQLADQVMGKAIAPDEADRRYGDHATELDNIAYRDQPPKIADAAGYAALKVLGAAIWDEQFDVASGVSLTEGDVDAYGQDTAFAACAAYSSGTIWMKDSSDSRRLEFWQWWLREALPSACQAIEVRRGTDVM